MSLVSLLAEAEVGFRVDVDSEYNSLAAEWGGLPSPQLIATVGNMPTLSTSATAPAAAGSGSASRKMSGSCAGNTT